MDPVLSAAKRKCQLIHFGIQMAENVARFLEPITR